MLKLLSEKINIVFPLIILFVIICHQLYVYFNQGKIDWFSDYTWSDSTFFILFILGLFIFHRDIGSEVNFLFIFYLVLGMIFLYLGIHGKLPWLKKFGIDGRVGINLDIIKLFSILYFVSFGLQLLTLINSRGINIVSLFLSGQLDYKLTEGYFGGNTFEYVKQLFWLPVIILFQAWLEKGEYFKGGALFIGLLLNMMFFKDRLGFILVIMLPVFFYHIRIKRIGFLTIFLMFILALIISGGFNFWRSQGFPSVISSTTLPHSIRRFGQDLNPVRWLYLLFIKVREDHISYDYFRQFGLTLAGQIPRFLWENKPITAFEPRYTELLFDVNVGTGVPIRTFTVIGEGIAMLGLVGVIINSYLFGFIYRIFRELLGKIEQTKVAWYSLCFMFFPYFRGSTSALLAYSLRTLLLILIFWNYIFIHGQRMPKYER